MFRISSESISWKIFRVIRTFFIIVVGSYFSIADSTQHALRLLKATLSGFNPIVLFDGTLLTLGLNQPNFNLLLISIIVLIIVDIWQDRGNKIRETIAKQNFICRWLVYSVAVFILIIFGMYGEGYNAANFIYQQF